MSESKRWQNCQEAGAFLNQILRHKPDLAIITGTGLSGIVSYFDLIQTIPYSDIPNMPKPSVSSHQPELYLVDINGKTVMIFGGRFHYYEGHSMYDVVFPVRIAQCMGIDQLIVTNAAGGLHSHYHPSEVVLVRDHIYMIPEHPLRGLTLSEWGNRFPDPKSIYDLAWRTKARDGALQRLTPMKEAVYACLQGPSLETPAELKLLKTVGADLVGMSSIPEVLAASQIPMRVAVLSVVTNIVDPDAPMDEVELQDVIDAANEALPILAQTIKDILND